MHREKRRAAEQGSKKQRDYIRFHGALALREIAPTCQADSLQPRVAGSISNFASAWLTKCFPSWRCASAWLINCSRIRSAGILAILMQIVYSYQSNAGGIVRATHHRAIVPYWGFAMIADSLGLVGAWPLFTISRTCLLVIIPPIMVC
jgi:hypothetical protein